MIRKETARTQIYNAKLRIEIDVVSLECLWGMGVGRDRNSQ